MTTQAEQNMALATEAVDVVGSAAGLGKAVSAGSSIGGAIGTAIPIPGVGTAAGALIGAIAGLVVGGVSMATRAAKVRRSNGPLRVDGGDIRGIFIEKINGVYAAPGTLSEAIIEAKRSGRGVKLTKSGSRMLQKIRRQKQRGRGKWS